METTCVGKNLEIRCGKGGAFAYENRGDQNLPRAHQCCLVIGPRGAGKTTGAVLFVRVGMRVDDVQAAGGWGAGAFGCAGAAGGAAGGGCCYSFEQIT